MALSIGHPIRDTCFEVAIAVALIGFFVFKCVKFDARTWWTGAFFLALFAAAPYQSLTSAFIDARLPIWFFLMLFACLKWRLEAANRSWNIGLVVLMVLGLGRTVDLSLRYISDNVQRDLAAADLSLVPGGSMIFQAAHVWALPLSPETWDPPLLHISCMEAIDRPLYLNNLFTLPQQQPLVDQFWLAPMIRDNYLRVPSQFRLPRVMNEAQTFQRNLFNHDQKSRSLYLFYIKPPYEKPITSAWEVVVDRKRYTLYKSRTNLVNPKSRF